MNRLQTYAKYKPTGVDWLGEVPVHWSALPNRALFREIIDKDHPDEQMLSVTIGVGVITQDSLLADSSKKDSSNLDRTAYKKVQPGDIAYNKMRAWQGAIGVSKYKGIVSPAYIVLRPSSDLCSDYVHFLFRTPAFAKEAERWSYGITSDQWSLRSEDFKRIYSLLPPLDEQIAIANFLDAMDARITTYIAAKRKMIALLEEQKQAIINQAVTRGLDPDVPLKPSGIDWLGDIPAHWEVIPLRRVTESRCDGPFGSGLKSDHYVDRGIRVIRLQNLGNAEFKDSDSAFISPAHYATLGNHDVVAGDVLIAGLGDELRPAGRACVAPDNIEPAMVKADCFRFRIRSESILSGFLAYQLSATAADVSAAMSTGATRQRVNLQTMSNRAIAVPPLQEQSGAVGFIQQQSKLLVKSVTRHSRAIELIQEYRTRLISDVVTGKLDVRGVDLPEWKHHIDLEMESLADDAGIDESVDDIE